MVISTYNGLTPCQRQRGRVISPGRKRGSKPTALSTITGRPAAFINLAKQSTTALWRLVRPFLWQHTKWSPNASNTSPLFGCTSCWRCRRGFDLFRAKTAAYITATGCPHANGGMSGLSGCGGSVGLNTNIHYGYYGSGAHAEVSFTSVKSKVYIFQFASIIHYTGTTKYIAKQWTHLESETIVESLEGVGDPLQHQSLWYINMWTIV